MLLLMEMFLQLSYAWSPSFWDIWVINLIFHANTTYLFVIFDLIVSYKTKNDIRGFTPPIIPHVIMSCVNVITILNTSEASIGSGTDNTVPSNLIFIYGDVFT